MKNVDLESIIYMTPEFCYFTPRRESLIITPTIRNYRLIKLLKCGFLPVLEQPFCKIDGTDLYLHQNTFLTFDEIEIDNICQQIIMMNLLLSDLNNNISNSYDKFFQKYIFRN